MTCGCRGQNNLAAFPHPESSKNLWTKQFKKKTQMLFMKRGGKLMRGKNGSEGKEREGGEREGRLKWSIS